MSAFPVEGSYRCAECKDWRHLMAWAPALVEGPLGADGELTEYSYVDDCDLLHEDSIHCTKHISAAVERYQNGQWCRWWACSHCGGKGFIVYNEFWGYSSRCEQGVEVPGKYGPWRMHEGWRPAAELVGAEVS